MSSARTATVSRPTLLVGGSDQTFRQFLHDFLVYSRRVLEVRDYFAGIVGVTPPQYEILSHVRQAGDPGLTIGAIAARLHASGTFATAEARKLAAAGLVTKSADPEDARRVVVRLTRLAHDRLARLAPIQTPVNDELFACIPPGELPKLADLMRNLLDDSDRALALVAFLSTSRRNA